MLKAGALIYAVFITFIISVLCGSFLMLSYSYDLLAYKQQSTTTLISNCNSQFYKGLYVFSSLKHNITSTSKDNNNQHHQLIKRRWGLYNTLSVRSYSINDTVTKSAIIGNNQIKNKELALYSSELGRAIHMIGKAKIIGDAQISKYGIKRSYLNNINTPKGKLIDGKKLISKEKLPKLNPNLFELPTTNSEPIAFNEFLDTDTSTFINLFNNPTQEIYFENNATISNITIKGNYLLRSSFDITLDASAKLEDIIIAAPNIYIEKGFKGALQLYASEIIAINKNVELQYPSAILMKQKSNDIPLLLELDNECEITGSVVIKSNDADRKNVKAIIGPKAKVNGEIYIDGQLQHQGIINGTAYIHKFFLETKSSKYENYILDGIINAKDLPDSFVRAPIFEEKNANYKTLKKI